MAAINGTATVTSFQYITAPEIWSLGIVMPIVTTSIVAVRFNTRRRQKLPFGIDEWLILGANITFIGIAVCFIIGVAKHVFGYTTPPLPANLVTDDEILNYLEPAVELVGKLEFALQLLTVVCYGFIKLSILAFYRQVFVVNKRSAFDKIVIGFAWVVFLWTITFILIIIFPCGSHVDNNWGTASQQIAHCLVIGYTSLDGLAASDFILDLVLICLPLPMIWQLHMRTSRKAAVSGIMLLGAAALGASLTRLVLYVQTQRAAEELIPVDFDEEITLQMYWSGLECGLAIIAACLPKLSSLVARFSVQAAVRSVRSVFSLHSANRSQTGSSGMGNAYVDIEGTSKTSSKAQIYVENEITMDSEAIPMDAVKRPSAVLAKW